MTRAHARLVEYAPRRRIALPVHATYEIVESPRPVRVPGAAPHALGLLAWQGRRIPMIDVARLVQGDAHRDGTSRHALVVAWQDAPGEPLQHGAIALAALPVTVEVRDEQACAPPFDSAAWPALASACFRHEDEAVPIVDTARLFSGG